MSAVTAYQEYYVLKTIHKTVTSIQTNSSIPHYASTPGSLTPWLLGFLASWPLGLLASRLNRDRRFNARIRIVADQLDVFVPKVG